MPVLTRSAIKRIRAAVTAWPLRRSARIARANWLNRLRPRSATCSKTPVSHRACKPGKSRQTRLDTEPIMQLRRSARLFAKQHPIVFIMTRNPMFEPVQRPTAPRAATPRPTTPRIATPRPTTPRVATPRPTTPRAATPRPTTPRAATPRPTPPRVATPRPATPRVATPRPTTPTSSDLTTWMFEPTATAPRECTGWNCICTAPYGFGEGRENICRIYDTHTALYRGNIIPPPDDEDIVVCRSSLPMLHAALLPLMLATIGIPVVPSSPCSAE